MYYNDVISWISDSYKSYENSTQEEPTVWTIKNRHLCGIQIFKGQNDPSRLSWSYGIHILVFDCRNRSMPETVGIC